MTPPREPDAIREAVAAGVRAFCLSLDASMPCGSTCDRPCLLCSEGVPAAIVAFLRALPGCDLRTPEDGDMTMDELAAAVERAAKEAGDG